MPRSPAPTRADATYDRLRRDILNGRIDAGYKLGFAELGARYAVSTGVLREVLPRLVEQGLATVEPQLGYRVVSVSEPALLALTEAREAIEGMVVRQAVERGDLSWEAALVAAHHELARTLDFDEDGAITETWMTAHDRFHVVLLEGCGNHYLVENAVRLRAIAEVYRCWTRVETVRTRRDVAGEHRAIADAAIAREGERCADLSRRHIRLTTDLLLGHPTDAALAAHPNQAPA